LAEASQHALCTHRVPRASRRSPTLLVQSPTRFRCTGSPNAPAGLQGHQGITADDIGCQRDLARFKQTGRSISRVGRDKTSNPTVDSNASMSIGFKKNAFQRARSC
jgi:hypothetical protein